VIQRDNTGLLAYRFFCVSAEGLKQGTAPVPIDTVVADVAAAAVVVVVAGLPFGYSGQSTSPRRILAPAEAARD
jgi:hypothetical protein